MQLALTTSAIVAISDALDGCECSFISPNQIASILFEIAQDQADAKQTELFTKGN